MNENNGSFKQLTNLDGTQNIYPVTLAQGVFREDGNKTVEASLKELETTGGPKGDPGESAYQIAVNKGYKGTEEEWIKSLKGKDGAKGPAGVYYKYSQTDISANNRDAETLGGKTISQLVLEKVYPIGSIYLSINNVSPSTFLGGTWELLKDTFLIGAGGSYGVNSTGGSLTHAHTLDDNGYSKLYTSSNNIYIREKAQEKDPSWLATYHLGSTISNEFGDFGPYNWGVTLGGSTASDSSLPPYLAVYMWKRTS